MILQASHTHLYPGHRGKISGVARSADIDNGRHCLIEFSDGSAAAATILHAARDWQLQVGAYRTAAGTAIAAQRWRLRLEPAAGGLEFRIIGKLLNDPRDQAAP